MKKLKMNNKGMSLVEVMVVVAIVTILGAVGIMGINAMTGKPAQKCVQQIMYSLEKHRTSTMGKASAQYVLSREANGDIYAKEYLSTEEDVTVFAEPVNEYKLGDKKMKISYVCSASGAGSSPTTTVLETTTPLTLQFDRSSGAFKKQGNGTYCTEIIVERGGRTYKLTLVPLTGKVYVQ